MDFRVFLILIAVSFQLTISRKYDVREEAIKLYGEDLEMVLKRFRRTPQYLSILTDKLQDIVSSCGDISLQAIYHYDLKLLENITEIINKRDGKPGDQPVDQETVLREINSHIFFPHQQNVQRYKLRQREGVGETATSEKTPIDRLDSYKIVSTDLTLEERNMFKDIGYEFADQLVHSIIKYMGNEDFSTNSTTNPHSGHGITNKPWTMNAENEIQPKQNTIALDTKQKSKLQIHNKSKAIAE